MKLKRYLISLFLLTLCPITQAQQHPKREFRGAWIQTVYQSQYSTMSRDAMQTYFTNMLDQLQQTGINAIIFQVRPMADAFYPSKLEPISDRYARRCISAQMGSAKIPDRRMPRP